MRIAFIGTHGTGKTTLIKELAKRPEFSNYFIGEEPMRVVSRMGFKTNTDADDASQLAMMALHEHYLGYENLLSDRSVIDAYLYAKYINETTGNVTDSRLRLLNEMMFKNIDKYDYLFWCRPDFDLVADGFRSEDKEFRNGIDTRFAWMAQAADIMCNKKFIELTGAVEQRLQVITKTLEEKYGTV